MNNNSEQPFGTNPQPSVAPPQVPVVMGMAPPPGYTQKSRMVAGILGILCGGLGIHNFYLGFTKTALIQLLVSLLTCGIGALPMEIWGLVEGIMFLTGSRHIDGQGVEMKD